MSPWEGLLALAERALESLRRGDEAGLLEALDERDRLAATLGAAPPHARPVLERLSVVQDQLVAELMLARDEAARELAALHRGRGAVQGYRSAAGGSPRAVDAGA